MPVFDFAQEEKENGEAIKTYTTFKSNEPDASPERPILVLKDSDGKMTHHVNGIFTNPIKRSSFEAESATGVVSTDILKVDLRFVALIGWLGIIFYFKI